MEGTLKIPQTLLVLLSFRRSGYPKSFDWISVRRNYLWGPSWEGVQIPASGNGSGQWM